MRRALAGVAADFYTGTLSFADLSAWLSFLAYRWSGYALLNWADDPAILAFVFC